MDARLSVSEVRHGLPSGNRFVSACASSRIQSPRTFAMAHSKCFSVGVVMRLSFGRTGPSTKVINRFFGC